MVTILASLLSKACEAVYCYSYCSVVTIKYALRQITKLFMQFIKALKIFPDHRTCDNLLTIKHFQWAG